MKNPIGIMQGRLSPPIGGKIQSFPWDTWEKEFYKAKEIGLDLIDWIVESNGFNENPLLTEEGGKRIKSLMSKTGINIVVVCADYFMDCPLLRCSSLEMEQRLNVLELLVNRLPYFGIKYLELPFVDNSAIKNKIELERVIEIIKPRLEQAYKLGVTFAFETTLPPKIFSAFLNELDHPAARANYDVGNSASLGYKPKEEMESYGDLVVTVHIKDRVLKGGTVPLGQGDADFATCFLMLQEKKYTGPYILQVARTNGESEIESAKNNVEFIKKYLN